MFFSRISSLALAVISLSAMAAAQDHEALAFSGLDFHGPPQILALDDCTNLEARPEGQYFHHLGSIKIPDDYACTLFSAPDCHESAESKCTVGDDHDDLLSFPGICADEARAANKGIGYTAESVLCMRITLEDQRPKEDEEEKGYGH